MFHRMMLLLPLMVISWANFVFSQDVLCSDTFCKNFITQNPCPDVPRNCNIQNTTHNGLELPFPGPCNCCKYCLENLNEGQPCSIGTATSLVPRNLCGPHLACSEKENPVCGSMETDCVKAQKAYDDDRASGDLGSMETRPLCDGSGQYEPFICVKEEICYCVNEGGKRIFGEIPYTNLASARSKCKCSRVHNSGSNLVGQPLQANGHLRCQSDGSYDPIQCLEDRCFCVDAEDAKQTYPGTDFVDVAEISNTTLQCFNNNVHTKSKYRRPCEEQFLKLYEKVKEFSDTGLKVYGAVFPNCQLDGNFAAVQNNKTHKYCVDPSGDILENYIVPIKSDAATTMNCNCARAKLIMGESKGQNCCSNGNYNSLQCRKGYCRCVDENGNQQKTTTKKEVEESESDSLKCTPCDSMNIV